MKRKIACVLVILFSLLQTGCWDAREIDELAFVLSIGLDKAEDGFKVTAQIASPDTYSKTPSGSGNQKAKPYWIISGTGKTIFEAIRNMSAVSSRRIFWSHIKVIVIGEEMARSNTLEIFDFFSRNPEIRLRALVAVTPGEAAKTIDIIPETEKDPSLYMEKIIENRSLNGKSYMVMLKDFLEDYLDPNVGSVTSRITLDKSKSPHFLKSSGAYIFHGGKMSGSLTEGETRGLLWIKNQMKDSIMVVNCPYDYKPVTLEIKKAKTSLKGNLHDGIPNFKIEVSVYANITEQSCYTNFNDVQKLNKLERAMEVSIAKDIKSTVTAAKNEQIDFIGLSRTLHSQHKDEWHKISSNWNELFKTSEVNIAVKVDIRHVSLAKPLQPSNLK